MHMHRISRHLLLVFVIAVSLAACDMAEQNYDYQPGNTLDIEGATQVVVPDTADYYVRAFTIDKDYSWSVSEDAELLQTRRQGEYIDVAFTEAGTYTIEVNDGEYAGTLEVEAVPPEE